MTIVTYHAISDRPCPFSITPDSFLRQIDFLQRNYSIIKLQQVPVVLRGDFGSKRHVVLTFDDAFGDFFQHAYPVLHQRKLPSTVFVPTGFIGGTNDWDINTRGYMRRTIMNSEQVVKLHQENLAEIGSHSVHHVRMDGLTSNEIRAEVVASRRCLEVLLGDQVTSFSYPYGELDQCTRVVRQLVAEAGYTVAVTTHWGTTQSEGEMLMLKRIRFLEHDSDQVLRAKVEGLYDWRTIKQRLAFTYRTIRRRILR